MTYRMAQIPITLSEPEGYFYSLKSLAHP